MKRFISLVITVTFLMGMLSFPAVVNAEAVIVDDRFTTPHPYTADVEKRANVTPFSGNDAGTWKILTPDSDSYPQGAEGNVMKFDGSGNGTVTYYNLPASFSGENVSFEMRFYWDQSQRFRFGFGTTLASIYLQPEGYIRNRQQKNGTGKDRDDVTKPIGAGWHQIKLETIPNSSNSDNYDSFKVYEWNGSYYTELCTYTSVYTNVNEIDSLYLGLSAGASAYIDWIKVTAEETVSPSNTLSAPNDVMWDGKIIKWSDSQSVYGYEVTLYKGNEAVRNYTVSPETKSYDFRLDLAKLQSGSYRASVTAKGTVLSTADSEPAYSDVFEYTYIPPQVLDTPQKPFWGDTVLKWSSVTNAVSYKVSLYKDGSKIKDISVLSNAYNMEMELFENGNGNYTAEVTAIGDGGDLYIDSAVSERSEEFAYVSNYDELTVFYDTFEEDNGYVLGELVGQKNGAWSRRDTSETTTGLYTIVGDAPVDTNGRASGNAIKLPASGKGASRAFSAKGTLVFDLLYYPETGSSAEFRISSATDSPNGNISFNENKIVAIGASGDMTVTESLQMNKWNEINITFKMSKGSTTYDVMTMSVNGTQYPAQIRFGCARIVTFTMRGSGVYIDNLRLGGLPDVSEPRPMATSVQIQGDDSGLLSGQYSFFSEIGSTENGSILKWYRADSQNGTYSLIPGAGETRYTMTDSDIGKWFKFEVTPIDNDGIIGETIISNPYLHRFKPMAQNVCYTDDGIKFIGSYVYVTTDNAREGSSKFRWLYCDTRDGQYIPIAGANSLSYTPNPQMRNKYIKFEVTPVTIEGTVGETSLSLSNSLTQTGAQLMQAAGALTFEMLTSQTNTNITQNLSLPGSIEGATVVWNSTDASVVSASGIVTRPQTGGNKYVTLTATLQKNGETYTKAFKLCVPSEDPYGAFVNNYVENVYLIAKGTTFRDVKNTDWFYSEIMWAVENKWFVGVSNELFNPQGLVTLRMAQIIKSRIDGKEEPLWAESPAITRAEFLKVLGIGTEILKGNENGDLMLDKTLTRAEACTILHRLERQG